MDSEAIDEVEEINEPEVPYHEATELFRSVESCRWDDAVRQARRDPEKSKVWVVARPGAEGAGGVLGAVDMGWNVWRRLPIHEVRALRFCEERKWRGRCPFECQID